MDTISGLDKPRHIHAPEGLWSFYPRTPSAVGAMRRTPAMLVQDPDGGEFDLYADDDADLTRLPDSELLEMARSHRRAVVRADRDDGMMVGPHGRGEDDPRPRGMRGGPVVA